MTHDQYVQNGRYTISMYVFCANSIRGNESVCCWPVHSIPKGDRQLKLVPTHYPFNHPHRILQLPSHPVLYPNYFFGVTAIEWCLVVAYIVDRQILSVNRRSDRMLTHASTKLRVLIKKLWLSKTYFALAIEHDNRHKTITHWYSSICN